MMNKQTVKVTIKKEYDVLNNFGYTMQDNGKLYVNKYHYFTPIRQAVNMLYPIIKEGLQKHRDNLNHDVWWFKTCIKWVDYYKDLKGWSMQENAKYAERYLWWLHELDYSLDCVIRTANICKEYKQYMVELVELANM